MNDELTPIIISFVIIISLGILFFKKVYRKGEQTIKLENNFLQVDNYIVDVLKLKKIILSSTYYDTVSPTETEIVIVSPIFDSHYRWRSHYTFYTFDMVQFNLDQRPTGYLYLWHKNKSEIEKLIKSILNLNKNITLGGEGVDKLNLN